MGHDPLSTAQILDGLGTKCLGRRVLLYPQVDSTNTLARSLAAQGEPEGTVVVAEEQTSGRGRQGRAWVAPAGTCLLFSLVLRPRLEPAQLQHLTMMAALALRDALRDAAGLQAAIKWPNDVLLSGRKVAGILTEARTTGVLVDFAILGIGLNVNLPAEALPPAFDATSIAVELGRPVPRVPLLQSILRQLEQRYQWLQAGHSPVGDWTAALVTLGRRVQVRCLDSTYLGLAEAVDDSGALFLRLDDGQLVRLAAGDAHTIRP